MRTILLTFFLLAITVCYGQSKYRKDFDDYWSTINDNFAYFDTQQTNWNEVKARYQPMADTVSSKAGFIRLLETVNNELYNGHISLNTNLSSSFRLIPTGADMWVVHRPNGFFISSIRPRFNAAISGLQAGMQITRYNGQPIDSVVRSLLPKAVPKYDKRMYEYAANCLLAGTHNGKRSITVQVQGVEQTFQPDSIPNRTETNGATLLESAMIAPGIGYLKINNTLGNNNLIKAFDTALDSLWPAKGLIIDLRETPSGGNTTVARAIMGRFINSEMPYQKHTLPAEEKEFGVKRSWIEWVSPREKIYRQPLVVLTSRWTGSMGEGITIGFDGMKRATIVGDTMAGLLGAIYGYQLPETGIGFSIPAEKLFHINGLPREQFVPTVIERDAEKCLATAIQLLAGKRK